ncbi:MAG: hypothetical protein AAGI69_15935 [Cyanobacteria bacterium P01_H01_bin.21]
MKFQRQLSEPYIVIAADSRPSLRVENPRHGSFFGAFWQSLLKLLLGSSEPIIEKQLDNNGQTLYSIYDRVTQQQISGLTEAEVRVWLEQRYYQKS